MNVEILELFIPIFMVLAIVVAFLFSIYLRHKAKRDTQETIRFALEKGAELSPEFMKQLSDPEPAKDRDLRRGLIWVAIGLAFALLGAGIPDEEATPILMGVAAFPILIGAAYLIMNRYGSKTES